MGLLYYGTTWSIHGTQVFRPVPYSLGRRFKQTSTRIKGEKDREGQGDTTSTGTGGHTTKGV